MHTEIQEVRAAAARLDAAMGRLEAGHDKATQYDGGVIVVVANADLAKKAQHGAETRRVLFVTFGQMLAGYRAHTILLAARPFTEQDTKWVNEELRMRLAPGGQMVSI